MKSLTVEVEFETPNPKDVPIIGRRKQLRVNGRMETLWTNEVAVERVYDSGRTGDGPSRYHYVGTVLYGPHGTTGSDTAPVEA